MNKPKYFQRLPIVVAILFVLTPLLSLAQNDSILRPTTIEVIQSYKPELKKVPKPEFHPSSMPKDTAKPALKYDVPQQTLYYSYTSLPLRPLALGKDTTPLPPSSYVKLGAGNLATLYLDAGTTRLHGKNYETSIHLHHLSQDGQIVNQQMTLSGLEAEGSFKKYNHTFYCNLNLFRNVYHWYGYDHEVYDYKESQVRQTLGGFDISFAAKNNQKNKFGIDYKPQLAFSTFSDAGTTLERNLIVEAPFTKTIDSNLNIGAGLIGNAVFYSSQFYEYNNSFFQANVFANYLRKRFSFYAAVNPTVGMEGTYLMPAFKISFAMPNIQSRFSLGYNSKLKQNTFKELSSYNPYMFTSYGVRQSKIDELYGQYQAQIEDHYLFSAKLAWLQYSNLPLFLNDFADGKQFYFVSDPQVQIISFNTNMHYQVANSFSLAGSFTYNYFAKHTYDKVWNEPGLSFLINMNYMPNKKLTLTAYMNLLSKIYSRNSNQAIVQQDPVFDMGGGIEYTFKPKFSVFFNVQNLLNNKYERWNQYQAYGINLFGGLRFKF